MTNGASDQDREVSCYLFFSFFVYDHRFAATRAHIPPLESGKKVKESRGGMKERLLPREMPAQPGAEISLCGGWADLATFRSSPRNFSVYYFS